MKKLILFLALLLTVSMSAFPQTSFSYNGIFYSVLSEEAKTVEVAEVTPNFAGGELIIPEKVYKFDLEYTVTGIGSSVFENKSSIASVSIPATVKTIGQSAFDFCTNLTSCTFEGESQLEQIGNFAFRNTGLINIKIPAAVKTIGDLAFRNCTNLTSCTFEGESQLEQIASNAFNTTRLIAIDIPASVSSIGADAFAYNTELRQVYMHRDKPDGYEYTAFDECPYVVIYVTAKLYEAYKNCFINNTVEGPIEDLAPEIEEGLKTLNTLSDEDRETINTSLATINKTESFSEAYAAYKAAMAIINAQTTMENNLKDVLSTLATKQNGPAIEIRAKDGTTIKLYNIEKVNFGKD